MGRNTRIEWTDATWNPVTGCKHGCEYCYARSIAQRFGCKITSDLKESTATAYLTEPYVSKDGVTNPYPYEFLPTFHEYRLGIPQTWKTPKNIFVCSMADLFGDWVEDDWIAAVIAACYAAPQHRYLFLTKNPARYVELIRKDIIKGTEGNFWLGTTTTRHNDRAFFTRRAPGQNTRCFTFISIEPILEQFGKCDQMGSIPLTDWVIVGAETGNRKGKVVPKKEWIMEIAEECAKYYRPIFMKDSLRELMGEDFRQEFPWKK